MLLSSFCLSLCLCLGLVGWFCVWAELQVACQSAVSQEQVEGMLSENDALRTNLAALEQVPDHDTASRPSSTPVPASPSLNDCVWSNTHALCTINCSYTHTNVTFINFNATAYITTKNWKKLTNHSQVTPISLMPYFLLISSLKNCQYLKGNSWRFTKLHCFGLHFIYFLSLYTFKYWVILINSMYLLYL